MPWGCCAVGTGCPMGILVNVSSTSLKSTRFAPATATPTGIPCASVRRLRFVPLFARSVGLGPVLFPPQRGFGYGAVHRLPTPVDPLGFVIRLQAQGPEFLEYARCAPL